MSKLSSLGEDDLPNVFNLWFTECEEEWKRSRIEIAFRSVKCELRLSYISARIFGIYEIIFGICKRREMGDS